MRLSWFSEQMCSTGWPVEDVELFVTVFNRTIISIYRNTICHTISWGNTSCVIFEILFRNFEVKGGGDRVLLCVVFTLFSFQLFSYKSIFRSLLFGSWCLFAHEVCSYLTLFINEVNMFELVGSRLFSHEPFAVPPCGRKKQIR
jgi:hypothetical protein